jgi:hypothetical protein
MAGAAPPAYHPLGSGLGGRTWTTAGWSECCPDEGPSFSQQQARPEGRGEAYLRPDKCQPAQAVDRSRHHALSGDALARSAEVVCSILLKVTAPDNPMSTPLRLGLTNHLTFSTSRARRREFRASLADRRALRCSKERFTFSDVGCRELSISYLDPVHTRLGIVEQILASHRTSDTHSSAIWKSPDCL